MADHPTYVLRDRYASWQKRRARKRARVAPERRARRAVACKAVVCAAVVATFLALALVVGDADYAATPIGWIPFLAVVVAIAFAFCYLQVLKRRVTFEDSSEVGDCERGSDVRFTVRFDNASPLFCFKIRAYFYVSDLYGNLASEASTTLSLSPFERYDLGFATTFDHIGTYTAGLDRIVICDFLGLFTATLRNDKRRQVSVVPKIQSLGPMRFSNEALLESTKAAKSVVADSMDYSHVREYVIGDPLKTIHWKLSARSDHYLTRLYEMYTNPAVGIVADFYAPSDEATELMGMFDAVVESAFSVGRYARERGMESAIAFRGTNGAARSIGQWTRADLPKIVDEMPKMSNAPADQAAGIDLVRALSSERDGANNLVVCTADVSAEMVSSIIEAKLQRRYPLLIAVVPRGLVGRDRDAYCSALSRLEAVDIPYVIITSADELQGVSA